MYRLYLSILLCSAAFSTYAQLYDTVSIFNTTIQLDSFVVKSSFDVDAFIRRVQTDTTFFKSFRTMQLCNNYSTAHFSVFDDKNHKTATHYCKAIQTYKSKCRTTKVVEQATTGKFFNKSGTPQYYTAALFFNLFYAPKPICNQTDIVAGSMDIVGKSTLEKNKYRLKQLIFNPGAKIPGIPFMGDKASIFDEGEKHKYNFRITVDTFNTIPCFVFEVIPKDQYKGSVVYNELKTWFTKNDYHIVARNYSLSYKTLVYDFDAIMNVTTTVNKEGKICPNKIYYKGDWRVIAKGRERMEVDMQIQYP